jgi:hypothetical protein
MARCAIRAAFQRRKRWAGYAPFRITLRPLNAGGMPQSGIPLPSALPA